MSNLIDENIDRSDRDAMKQKAKEIRSQNAEPHKLNQKLRCDNALAAKLSAKTEVNINGCCQCVTIIPSDFGPGLDTTFVISSPGKYVLNQDVIFSPLSPFTPAINILSSNVVLDLCNHTLSQGNTLSDCYGVQIGEGYYYNDPDAVLQNVTIQNGSIINFTSAGVFCWNGSFDGPTAELPFDDLRFSKLNILDCGTTDFTYDYGASINLDSSASINRLYLPTTKVAYKNVRIEHCNLNRCKNGSGSVNVGTYENLFITDTQCNDSFTYNSNAGLSAYSVPGRNLSMIRCQGNGTKDFDPTSGTYGVEVIGLWPGRAINVYLEDCQFNETYGDTSFIVNGGSFTGVYNLMAKNCQFNNTRGGDGAGFVTGVHASDRRLQQFETDSWKIIDCQFNGSRISDNSPGVGRFSFVAGFLSLSLRNIAFVNCQACNIISNNPLYGSYGFLVSTTAQDPAPPFSNTENISFENCLVSDIKSNGKELVGIGMLFGNYNRTGIQSSLTNISVKNCTIKRLQNLSSIERTAGIGELLFYNENTQFPLAKNLLVQNCDIADVRAGTGNPFSAGILVESVRYPNIIENVVSDCDRGVLFTGNNVITPNGFQLATSLNDALAFPPVFVNLATPLPSSSPLQIFTNVTKGNSVSIAPSATTIDTTHDFILPSNDLTALRWEAGDQIAYNCNGGNPIPNLTCGATYYLIVYKPGYTEKGLIKNNNVSNCSISGYQDDKTPCTNSAWVSNTAFCNGHKGRVNYKINWSGKEPVAKGSLSDYPVPKSYIENISIKCDDCCDRNKHGRCGCKH